MSGIYKLGLYGAVVVTILSAAAFSRTRSAVNRTPDAPDVAVAAAKAERDVWPNWARARSGTRPSSDLPVSDQDAPAPCPVVGAGGRDADFTCTVTIERSMADNAGAAERSGPIGRLTGIHSSR